MAWSTPRTYITAEVVTATHFNQTRDQLLFLYQPPVVSMSRTGVQSIPNNTLTLIAFDAEQYDTDTMHSTTVNNSRATVNTAGKYLNTASAEWSSNAAGRRYAAIYRNGVAMTRSEHPPCTTGEASNSLSIGLIGSAADYFEMYVFQDSGGALNMTPLMQVTHVAG